MRNLICQNCNISFEAGAGNFKFCPDCRLSRAKRYAFYYARRSFNYDACPSCNGKKDKDAQMCNKCWTNYRKGENHPRWKGGRYTSRRDNYVVIRKLNGTRILEHHLVWEETHKRKLPKNWIVHHFNGIRNDNRPENLIAMPRKYHPDRTFVNALQKRIRELEQLHLPM